MELIDKGRQFVFGAFFENISEEQLSQLIWFLTLGENPDQSHIGGAILCHKIGRGKPLRPGGAKIIVEGAEARPATTGGDKINCQACDYNGLNNAADPDARMPRDFDGHFKLWPRRNELE
ncbi:MAG: hypothetical protein LBU32_24375 [Clostridiales bacterium]|jgi:hypothetical protein|nr:hypothetical protein [Clostridiales bacterium]